MQNNWVENISPCSLSSYEPWDGRWMLFGSRYLIVKNIFVVLREKERFFLSGLKMWPWDSQWIPVSVSVLVLLFKKFNSNYSKDFSNWIYIVGVQSEILGQKQNKKSSYLIGQEVSIFLLQFTALLRRNFSIAISLTRAGKLVYPIKFYFLLKPFPHPPPLRYLKIILASNNH